MSSEPDLLAALGRSIEKARAHATTRQMRDSRPMTATTPRPEPNRKAPPADE